MVLQVEVRVLEAVPAMRAVVQVRVLAVLASVVVLVAQVWRLLPRRLVLMLALVTVPALDSWVRVQDVVPTGAGSVNLPGQMKLMTKSGTLTARRLLRWKLAKTGRVARTM